MKPRIGITKFISGFLSFILTTGTGFTRTTGVDSPWNSAERRAAVVRIEINSKSEPSVGAGAIVAGKDGRYFILTSAHVLFGRSNASGKSDDCIPHPSELRIFRPDRDGEVLETSSCGYKLGQDLALIALKPRTQAYPHLNLRTMDFKQYDLVYVAGYPNGFPLDPTRSGYVSHPKIPQSDLVGANIVTMEGMSGGPYLTIDGFLVGIHNGGVSLRPGLAQFTSIKRRSSALEHHLGDIRDHSSAANQVLAAEAMREGTSIGTLLALQLIDDKDLRVQVWEEHVRRAATADETTILRQLPARKATTPLEQKNKNILQQDGGDVISITLGDVQLNDQVACSLGMRIDAGILLCDDEPRFIGTRNKGGPNSPEFLVFHYTATKDLPSTIAALRSADFNASAHFLIDRDGTVVQMVSTDRVAYHAGRGKWRDFDSMNKVSIGVELINLGRLHKDQEGAFRAYDDTEVPESQVAIVTSSSGEESYWQSFTGIQLHSAQQLARELESAYSIKDIIGHCHLAPGRKVDPGPAFPLDELSQRILSHGISPCTF
jgi:N-acetylmuramoyl-L-alanine amidase